MMYMRECHEKEVQELKENIHHTQMKAMDDQALERQKV